MVHTMNNKLDEILTHVKKQEKSSKLVKILSVVGIIAGIALVA